MGEPPRPVQGKGKGKGRGAPPPPPPGMGSAPRTPRALEIEGDESDLEHELKFDAERRLQEQEQQQQPHGRSGFSSLRASLGRLRKGPMPPLPPPSPTAIDEMGEDGARKQQQQQYRRVHREKHHSHHLHLGEHLHFPRPPSWRPHSLFSKHSHEDEYAFEHPDNVSSESDESDSEFEYNKAGGTDPESGDSQSAFSEETGGRSAVPVEHVKGAIKGAKAKKLRYRRNRHICERIFIAMLAVSILWVTSYALSRALVNSFIDVPEWDEVRNVNQRAYDSALAESSDYIFCINEVVGECQERYDRELKVELGRVKRLKDLNDNRIRWLVANRTLAEQLVNRTIEQINLRYPTNIGDIALNPPNNDKCGYVEGLVKGEDAAINALNAANEFKDQADKRVRTLEEQLAARREYDRWYIEAQTELLKARGQDLKEFVQDPDAAFDKLGLSLAGIKGCMDGTSACSGPPAVQTLADALGEIIATFDSMKQEAIKFKEGAQGELQKYSDLCDELREGGSVGSYFLGKIANLRIPRDDETGEPRYLDEIESYSMGTAAQAEKAAGAIFEAAAPLVGRVDDKLGISKTAQEVKVEDIRQATDDYHVGWDSDYDPPPVFDEQTNRTRDAYWEQSAALMPGLNTRLQSVQVASAEDPIPIDSVGNTTARLEGNAQDIFNNVTDHSVWDFYAYDESILKQVQVGFSDITSLLITFDFVFRALHTLYIIRKYWIMSSLSTPPGDARVKASAGNGWGPKRTPLQRIADIITNPLVIALVLTATVVVLLYIIWYMYSPLYYEYMNSCVLNNENDIVDGKANGTMLYRNGYSVLYQYSASEGDKLALEKVDELNVGRDVTCNQNAFADTVIFNDQIDVYNANMERLFSAIAQNAALSECLNLPRVEEQYPSSPVHTWATDDVFSNKHEEPDVEAVYDCNAVTACPAIRTNNETSDGKTCTGPKRVVLRNDAHVAACTTENWFHANVFGSFLVTATFILMNISRLFFMRAVVRLGWRHLVSGPFSFLGSCTDTGKIVYPERVVEKGDSMQVAIREAVKLRLKRWERWGYLILLTALAINAPWIWALHFLSNNLTYEP